MLSIQYNLMINIRLSINNAKNLKEKRLWHGLFLIGSKTMNFDMPNELEIIPRMKATIGRMSAASDM